MLPDPHWLLSGTSFVLISAVAAAVAGISMPVCLCLCLVALAPVVTVVGYEWRGHRHQADSLAGDAASGDAGAPHA